MGSKFFRDIFDKSKHSNLVIYLKGIDGRDLENVLKFLYNGEAFIAQEELNNFLTTAQELKVNGLQVNQMDENDHDEHTTPDMFVYPETQTDENK